MAGVVGSVCRGSGQEAQGAGTRPEGSRIELGLPPVPAGVLIQLRDKIPEGQMIPCYGHSYTEQ